jgi:cytochrome c
MMTIEPGNEGAASAGKVAPEAGSGLSPTSPLRLLFVIVPLLVIVTVGSNLLGLWSLSSQQAAREERERQQSDPAPVEEGAGSLPPELERLLGTDPLPNAPQTPAEDAPSGEAAAAKEAPFAAAAVVALLSRANTEEGAATFKTCWACHTSEKGEPAIIGPNLWGVVGRPKASERGYRYSEALKGKGGTWSYEALAELIHNPRAFAPGTSMAFRGIEENARIANLIAYLRTLSDDPVPLPQ